MNINTEKINYMIAMAKHIERVNNYDPTDDIMKKLSLRELEYLSGLLEMVANANRLVPMYEEEIERLEGIINQQKI